MNTFLFKILANNAVYIFHMGHEHVHRWKDSAVCSLCPVKTHATKHVTKTAKPNSADHVELPKLECCMLSTLVLVSFSIETHTTLMMNL